MNKDFEISLIGYLLEDSDIYIKNSERIHEGLFMDEVCKSVFKAFLRVLSSGVVPDLANLTEEAGNEFKTIIKQAFTELDYTIEVESLISNLTEQYNRAQLLQLSSFITECVKNKTHSIDILRQIEEKTYNLSNFKEFSAKHISKTIGEFIEFVNTEKTEGLTGISLGQDVINEFTGGVPKGELFILGADAGTGKTAFALSAILDAASNYGQKMAIFSGETSALQLNSRMTSILSGVPAKRIMNKEFYYGDIDKLTQTANSLKEFPIWIDESYSTKTSSIINSIRKLKLMYKIDGVVIDYLQLLKSDGSSNPEENLARVSRELKNCALELDVAIIALSQLRRRDSKAARPSKSDLRGSGQIEEAADTVAIMVRPENNGITEDEEGNSTKGLIEWYIDKGRNIGLENFYLLFDDYTKTFSRYE